MAVTIAMPREEESKFDRVLRRVGGVAQVAKSGLDAYSGFKDMRATAQARQDKQDGVYSSSDLDKDWVQAQEGEDGAQQFKIRVGDDVVTRAYKRYSAPKEAKPGNPIEDAYTKAKTAEIYSKINGEKAKVANGQSLAVRLKSLNSSDKARVDNVQMALKSLQSMDSALAKGDNTFSLFGDNDFTMARRSMAEAIGRMQSGGAINKDEEERFLKMVPTATDSTDIQTKKLAQLKEEMESRGQTLGFKAEEVGGGYALGYGKKKQTGSTGFLGVENANAGPKGQPNTVKQNGVTYTLNPKTGKYE